MSDIYYRSLVINTSVLPPDLQLMIFETVGDPVVIEHKLCMNRLCEEISCKSNTISVIRLFSGFTFRPRPIILTLAWIFVKYNSSYLSVNRNLLEFD